MGLFLPYGWKRLVPSRLFPLCACDVDVLEAWTERKRCVNLIYFFVLLSHVWLYDFACVMKLLMKLLVTVTFITTDGFISPFSQHISVFIGCKPSCPITNETKFN